jgi:hypothetical protein
MSAVWKGIFDEAPLDSAIEACPKPVELHTSAPGEA